MVKEKTVVLVDLFFQLRASTGIKTYTNTLIAGLNSIDRDVRVEYTPSIQFVERLGFFQKDTRPRRLIFHFVYHLWKTLLLHQIARKKKVDILICPDYVVPSQVTGYLKVPIIHSSFFWEYPEHYSQKWLRYYKGLINKGLSQHQMGITTSHFTKNRLEKYLPKTELHVSYQAIKIRSETKRETINKKDLILHVGYFDRRKNIKVLVEAFAQLIKEPGFENYQLQLIGGPATPTNDTSSEIRSLIKDLGIENQAQMLGYISNARLSKAYREAKLYAFPSLNEGFGIPILEAFSYDLPVIVSNRGPLKEVGGDAVRVFDAENAIALKTEMKLILKDKQLQAEMRSAGQKRLLHFTPEKFADDILTFCLEKLKDG